MSFLSTFKNFMELTRGYALGVTFASCLIIYSFAHYSENFRLINFIILVLGLCFVHMGGNLFDDYIDVRRKLKEGYTLQNMSFDSFVPKAWLIRNDTFSMEEALSIIKALFCNAILIGLYLAIVSGWHVLVFAFVGAILVLFYPISARYGLSEIVIGLIYGPLMIIGGYYAMTGTYNSSLIFLSVAIFFSTLVLLHTDNIMDWEFDYKNNKKTLCILSGNKINAIKMLKWIIIISYSVIVLGVLLRILNPFTLYVFLTLPIATKLMDSIKEYVLVKDVKFIPKWYYGMFENWKTIQEKNIAFYMFRFYLARNYAFWFALFAFLGTISGPYLLKVI